MNNTMIIGRLNKACATEKGMLTILKLNDIASFRDCYGDELADRLKQNCVFIINRLLEQDDIKAFLGDDEFILFCKDMEDKKELLDLYKCLDSEINNLVVELLSEDSMADLIDEDSPISMGVSMGAARVPDQGNTYEELFRKAYKALEYAANEGRHEVVFYEDINVKESAMWLDTEEYTIISNYLRKYIQTYDNPACEMMITLTPSEEEMSSDVFDKVIMESGTIIAGVLRKSDAITLMDNTFYLLLPEMNEQNIMVIVERIKRKFISTGLYDLEKIVIDSQMIGKDGEYTAWSKVAV